MLAKPDDEFVLFFGWTSTWIPPTGWDIEPDLEPMGAEFQSQEDFARKTVLKRKEELAKTGVPEEHIKTMLRECGDVREEILKVASEEKVDIIALGSRGHGTVGSLLLGSVSTYVVQHASCSVMVIR